MNFLGMFGIVSAFVSFVACIFNAECFDPNISGIIWAPLLFFIFLSVFEILNYRKNFSRSLMVRGTIAVQWVRAVVMPFAGAFSSYFSNMSIPSQTLKEAAALFLYENVAIYLLLFILNSRDQRRSDTYAIEQRTQSVKNLLSGNKWVYFAFFALAAVIYLVLLRGSDIFTFIVLDAQQEEEIIEEAEGGGNGITYIFLTAIIIFIIYISYWCAEKFEKNGRKIWVILAVAICLLRISLLTGSGRMGQIYICCGLGAVLLTLFPKQRKGILFAIVLGSLVVVISVSIYKTFFVSAYGDYRTAMERQGMDFELVASQINAYLAGPSMIASNLDFINTNEVSYTTLFYDIFRNIFGVHYLFKDGQVGTTGYYNLWIYGGRKSGGCLFSGTAYSALYFTPLLAPLSVIVCLSFAYYFERKAREARFVEWKYLHTLAFSRLLLCSYISFTGSLNIISRNYVLFGIVILLSRYVNLGQKNKFGHQELKNARLRDERANE